MSSFYSRWVDQRIMRIDRWELGGLPGQNPAWLVGSIFYHGDKLLENERGGFKRGEAREKIEEALSVVAEKGLVLALDVVFPSVESVEPIMEFIAEYDVPLFLDSPDPEARMKSYRVARELGVAGRSIANGLYTDSPPEEPRVVAENKLAGVVLMTFDPRNAAGSMDPESRLKILEERLLPMARGARLENIIVDAVVIDPASIALSAETIHMVKEKHGYPSGCAPANALGSVSEKTVGQATAVGVHGGVAAYLRVMGADYIMYGPVKRVKYIADAVAMIDSLIAYSLRRRGLKIEGVHPLKTYLKVIQKLFISSS